MNTDIYHINHIKLLKISKKVLTNVTSYDILNTEVEIRLQQN
jgi:hypothetical protein